MIDPHNSRLCRGDKEEKNKLDQNEDEGRYSIIFQTNKQTNNFPTTTI